MGLSLRPAVAGDASVLAALSIEVWLSTYIKRGITPEFADYVLSAHTAEHFEALIADPAQRIVVSENVEGIDGFVRVAEGCPDPVAGDVTVEIATLYVQPRHHGRGVGKALLAAALEGQTGPVWVATNSENTPAIEFYLRNGFTRIGVTHFTLGEAAYPNDVFRWDPV
ncbi:MAG: GNAT family N-acetyltransferase [Pseudomonadota bacterium]